MVKKGDTLIEVTIAVGIFAMVTVAIVAVMSSGTSGAQTALETTLAREEIDTQAEALRFIQSGYITARGTDTENTKSPYTQVWEKIIENAVNPDSAVVTYSPSTCSELYEDQDENGVADIADQHAFVINPRILGSDLANSYVSAIDNNQTRRLSEKFIQTTTYPRLVFNNTTDTTDNEELIADASKTDLYRAEGLYVVAVKSTSATTPSTDAKTAFYDFYIRSCWYGTGDQNPSSISTVIRLSDPAQVKPN